MASWASHAASMRMQNLRIYIALIHAIIAAAAAPRRWVIGTGTAGLLTICDTFAKTAARLAVMDKRILTRG